MLTHLKSKWHDNGIGRYMTESKWQFREMYCKAILYLPDGGCFDWCGQWCF